MLTYFKQFDNKKIALIIISLLFILIMIIVFFQFNNDRYVAIYKNINESDKINIIKYFHQWGANYIETNDEVTVLEQDARSLRIKLAYEGIPAHNSSIGYEIFDSEETLGSSSFSQNINMLRALEGELSRSLSSFENIKSARVHLVLPKREVFTLKNDVQVSSASVILSLYDNNNISQKQIKAMLHLISSSVPKLSTKNITIVSTSGKTFYLASDINDNEEESLDQSSDFDYKKEVENKLTNRAQNLLELSFGNNRIKVEVVADINTDKEIIDSETFNPDEQVVRSSHNIEEKNQSKESSPDVSAANNIPNANQNNENADNSSRSNKTEEITNYDISKEIRKFVKGRGVIKKLSVAVLVDFNYIKNENGEMTSVKRDDIELSNIEKLVKSAVGFDSERGDNIEVVNMKFYELSSDKIIQNTTWRDWLEIYSYDLIKMVLWTIIILLISFFVIKPLLIKWLEINNPLSKSDLINKNDINSQEKNDDEEDSKKNSDSDSTDAGTEQISTLPESRKKAIVEKLKYAIDNNSGNVAGLIKHIINS